MKNIGQYNQDLSVPRKKDIDSLEARVKTNEDNIAMAESDIESLQTDVGTLKTDVGQVKTALNFKQDTITGGASTITDNNLIANHALVSNGSGKVEASTVTSTELGYLDGATSNIQTQLNKKIEKVRDNDISWGGKNLSDEVSPTDAAMVSVIGGNKFALCKPQGITIEYTNDAGTTWKNYDTTDEIKINVISGISKTKLYYGKKTESSQIVTADDMLRITVNAFTCGVYTFLRKILIEFATGGSIDDSVKIESATIGDQEAFTVVGTYAVKGNSGWNSIPYSNNFGAYTLNQTSNVGVLRFTFSTKTAKGNPSVQNLILNGIANYVNPNKLSATGHLYSYDYQQNAIFPAKLTATSFEGDGSALTNISYPVTSVNTKTGAVTLGASDIGALPLAGGTLTGPLVLGNEDAQIKIGEAGVIFNPLPDEPQIVISDSNYATQYITLSSSQTKIVGGTQFTNTNMTLASDGITIQKLESGVPSTAILSGISDGVNANDAVNLSQLNKVKNSIPTQVNENLLVNGYLLDPINTIGSWNLNLSNTIRAICNGWTAAAGSNTTINLNRKNGGVVINSMIDATSFYNVTGNINIKLGKTYTFSVLKKVISDDGVSITSTFTTTATTSSSHDNGLYTITFTAENNTGYVGIDIPATVEVTIYGAKLEEGSIQTLCYKDSSGNWVQHIPNKADEFARCSQWNTINKYIGNALLPLSGGTMTGSINMGDKKITKLADGMSSSDAVNLGQLNKASLNGPITVIFNNIVLKSSKELFPRSWYSCVYTGRIYGFEGSAFIDTSKIKGFVAVGEMSGGYGAGPCSVAYSDGAVAITTLVTMDPTAPNQVKIPCLYWY